MDKEQFWTICSMNNIIIEKEQLQLLVRYHNEILYWNKKVNLISRKDEENIWSKHILHSLSILKYCNFSNKSNVLDIGTGGGLPGIPVKILRQDLNMVLIDSIAKKIKATEMFAKHTELKNIKVIRKRAEELKFNSKFDYIIARAVSKIENLIFWTKHLTHKNSIYVLLKGGNLEEEIISAKKQFPNISIEEKDIILNGYNNFLKEEKKIIFCFQS